MKRKSPDQKPSIRPVRLPPILDDAVCSWAIRHRCSVHAAMVFAIRRLVLKDDDPVYKNVQPSPPQV